MEFLSDPVVLSRLQFAITSIFHMLWPVLTIGMSIYLIILEILWLYTKKPEYYLHIRFWSKLYVLNFGIGVASGVVLEFEFGTNWAPFSIAVGDFLGSILGFEGAMAFMLEAGFLGIMLFGWNRVPPVMHLIATIMVSFGASLSSFWIMVANSWMQTPVGGEMVNGKYIIHDYFEAILNPSMGVSFCHMFFATLETALFVIGGISAWYILTNRHPKFFELSLKIVLSAAIIVTPLQVYIGHLSGDVVYHYQPSKLAAIEGRWETVDAGQSAPWSILIKPNITEEKNDFEFNFPDGLGYILEFKKTLSEPVLGLKEWKPEDRPQKVGLIFYSFRIMAGIGFFLVGLMLWSVWEWIRGGLSSDRITQQRWLLICWVLSAPLGYIAVETGWTVREVGRQPWVLQGLIRVSDAVSNLPVSSLLSSLIAYTGIYLFLFFAALYFGRKIILKGPDLDIPLPSSIKIFDPSEHIPDNRPTQISQP